MRSLEGREPPEVNHALPEQVAMGSGSHQQQRMGIGQRVNREPIASKMAISEPRPGAGKRVIPEAGGKRLVDKLGITH